MSTSDPAFSERLRAATELSVLVRRAIAADAGRLAELSGTLGYPVSAADLGPRLERAVARPEDLVLVALVDSEVIGWIHATENEPLETGCRCEIMGLIVDPRHRKHGVGRRLVSAVEQWAAKRGLHQVTARSNVTRLESHTFYERLGYSRVKTQHTYRKAVADTRP